MLGKTKNIHFIGIGGAGMSGIAEFLHNQGFIITGSDMNPGEVTGHLKKRGIKIIAGHRSHSVEGADVVVKSSAVTDDNIEVRAARERNIPVIRRAEMLAELMRMSYGIAIAGTHGKTTTTSMTGIVLIEAGLKPAVIVGGRVMNFGSNNILGCGKQIVVEADEFDRSFLTLSPIIAGITNIEADHLDCYEDLDAIKDAFVEYADKVPFFGCIVACYEDKGVRSIIPRLNKRIVSYGIRQESDIRAINIRKSFVGTEHCSVRTISDTEGTGYHTVQTTFDVLFKGELLGEITLGLYGEHNILNSLMAIAVGLELDVPFSTISSALKSFQGVFRRCEFKGSVGDILFYDDYAHHPTEIIATLKGLKETTGRRVVALFQPHLYSRTNRFACDFGESFHYADLLIVTPIYPAREKPVPGVTGKMIADAALTGGGKKEDTVYYIEDNQSITSGTLQLLKEGDLLVTIGAGDIYKYGEEIMRQVIIRRET